MVDYVGDDTDNVFDGTAGADTAYGRGGQDRLSGLGGNDVLYGEAGDDQLYGGDGDDSLFGGTGTDIVDGGGGVDLASYTDSAKGVTVNLADGTAGGGTATGDTLTSIESVDGSAHGDTLIGSDVANALRGDGGDDVLRGGFGADILDGGDGFDLVTYFDSAQGVRVDLIAGTGSGGAAAGDILVSIEAANGSAGGDILVGNDVDNILRGGDGADLLHGRLGADTLDGGAGYDLVTYFESTEGVTVNLAAGTGSGGTAAGDRLVSIENVNGSAHADALVGNDASNIIGGGAGDDVLSGGDGGDGFDGGAGADTIDGEGGGDTVRYFDSTRGVTVDLAAGTGNGGTATGDALISIEGAFGSTHADTLIGSSDANSLFGYDGDDVLRGGDGADNLGGGAGFDVASYSDSTEAVVVNLASGNGSGGTAAGDFLSISIEAVNGSAHADRLIGSGVDNTLTGAGGRDVLTGGAGTDRFVFATGHSSLGTNADRITDFSHAQGDRIDLSRIDANGGGAGEAAFIFIGTGAYTGVAGQLRYALSGTDAVIGGDTDGDGVSDFEIVLSDVSSLQAADFVL